MITKYGEVHLNMKYTDDELAQLIEEYFNSGYCWSYKSLCKYVFNEAIKENKLNKEENTEYSTPEMSSIDASRITKLLWKKIWEKEIYIEFSYNDYTSPDRTDFYFGQMS